VKARLEGLGKGPVTLQSGKVGQFDVSSDGTLLFSRSRTGRFPSDDEIVKLFALKA
jgi:predicted Rdx family selenoprotein